jgi:mannobiose 2-epimerase
MPDLGKLNVIPDLREHLLTRVLPFWAQHSIDPDHGGFITHLSREGEVTDASTKYLVMQARMIYSFTAGCALGGPKLWLSAASQGAEFLLRHFRDVQHDGWFWSVSRAGRPVETAKRMYGHAFVVYALSEYARLTRDRRALAAAVHTCSLIARHLWDEEHGGVFEACDRAWTPTERGHTMGTHLHTLEAMLAMNEAMGDHRFWPRARQVADLIVSHMVEPESGCGLESFHADWTRDIADPKRALINYGHNLEAAWLLLRVHRAEPNAVYRETARGFLDYVMQYGLDTNYGGIYSHGPLNAPATVREKIWWVQCEALPAFLLGYLEFGEERYFDAFSQTLRFSLDHLYDPVFGEWYHSAEEDGAPRDQAKGSAWKAAYHVTQALAYADGYLREVAGG